MPTITQISTPEQIETDATRRSIAGVTTYLQEHLGQRVTAYLSGLKDAKTVGQWAAGKVTPRDVASLRLRHAYQAVRLIVEAFGDETAKAWLFGMNRQLDDEAPGYVLRNAERPEEVTPVVLAALSFVETAYPSDWGESPGASEDSREASTFADSKQVSDLARRVVSLERAQADLVEQIKHLIQELEKPAEVGGSGRGFH